MMTAEELRLRIEKMLAATRPEDHPSLLRSKWALEYVMPMQPRLEFVEPKEINPEALQMAQFEVRSSMEEYLEESVGPEEAVGSTGAELLGAYKFEALRATEDWESLALIDASGVAQAAFLIALAQLSPVFPPEDSKDINLTVQMVRPDNEEGLRVLDGMVAARGGEPSPEQEALMVTLRSQPSGLLLEPNEGEDVNRFLRRLFASMLLLDTFSPPVDTSAEGVQRLVFSTMHMSGLATAMKDAGA